ncbi:hypothetical protein AG1IA_06979 [Rhizoctonia solani AG-1 IA]|uniref:Uncharacterized protein n=1 Tax=Thanatephorus cucumeris (strain AG1-IA) TaxID=983506 RepID=L8WRI4_THACA|nr:hypothetical protein AG1IA_06979 [Rhizoctonia solani AG-1 IA]
MRLVRSLVGSHHINTFLTCKASVNAWMKYKKTDNCIYICTGCPGPQEPGKTE